uniref:Uncharacterized protein n=1 Tax=Anguilla anguilla TaxID=7936 RepID=A0A0E9W8D7_ANGAN
MDISGSISVEFLFVFEFLFFYLDCICLL